MKDLAIFGINDSFAGQVVNFLPSKIRGKINCLISLTPLSDIKKNISFHSKSHDKIEYPKENKIFGFPVFHDKDFTKILKKRKIKKVLICEDRGEDRLKIFKKIKKLKKKIEILKFIHKNSFFSGKNNIGEGSIIFPNNYFGYKTDVGKITVIQSGCNIEHHNTIGDYCDINPKVTTGGFTKIHDGCEINISVDIINRIIIEKNSRVGAGSLVLKNIRKSELHYGRPAKLMNKIE